MARRKIDNSLRGMMRYSLHDCAASTFRAAGCDEGDHNMLVRLDCALHFHLMMLGIYSGDGERWERPR